MPGGEGKLSSALFASQLRAELCERNRRYAEHHGLVVYESHGQTPAICYQPSEDRLGHGNFLRQSYRAVLKNPAWQQRLSKVHTTARTSLPRADRR